MQTALEVSIFEILLETGKAITSEIEMENLVQRITDVGTQVSGAEFGAFFFNKVNESGEKYVLYTISGVPREAFSKFPMPRNTKIFDPTFAGKGTVRYDDVTAQPHFGQNPPYNGMPKGHLPVRSYLATPVVSPLTKEVIGGLFFGHPEAGVFTERSEKLIEGVAAQAAIAMGNAQLFEEKKNTEARLREQSEQYQSVFYSSPNAMIIIDEQGGIIDANPAATHTLGYTYDELLRKSGGELLAGSQDELKAIISLVRSGRRYNGVNDFLKPNGTRITTQVTGTHVIRRDLFHILLFIKDITADREAEEALRKSEAFGQIITNVSPVVLWMTNEKGETIYINQTWLDWSGSSYEDSLQYGWINFIVEEDREAAGAAFMRNFEKRNIHQFDFRIRKRDGSTAWVSSYGTPYYGPNGSFGGYAGSLTDITERKLSEQKLQSQHVLINTITNNTQQALFMMDDRQVCTYMNPAAEAMIGYKLEEVRDKPLHYYIHHTHPDGRHFPLEDCAIDRALPTKMQTQGEEVFIRKNGEFFTVAFTASPIIENGIPIGTVIEVRETTEEKRIQEELRQKERQAMELLEQKVRERTQELEKINYELMQFTSVASHDLKEPVRKVSIFSDRLRELAASENEEFHKYLNNIMASSKRMARLIDDLLAFSRVSQAQQELSVVDLNTLMQQILDDLQIAIAEKKATVSFDNLPVVKGVDLQLGQVFQNLISNSLKFSEPHRPPVITIKATCAHGLCRIVYKDNGIGFNADAADRIFNIFERLHPKDKYEGTGIGLAIVKKIIGMHGGTITAKGYEGKGAEFVITLPAP